MTGIVTPGLTCARELGRDAAGQIAAYLGAEETKTFSGSRRAPFRFRRLSPEERAQLPPSDKTDLICRCEQVTREEILQAIHANPGAVTLDGIKRRTCAGMGRCQGQRCMTEILKILAEERMLVFDQSLMSFTMGNAITLVDTNGNRKLMKRRADAKIDAVAAMMDAYVSYKLNGDAFE